MAEKKVSKEELKDALIAKKAFVICHNEFYLEINKGDNLGSVPEMYLANLKTEGVI